MNEYEKIYYANYGFEFSYNRRISKSKPLSWYRVKYLESVLPKNAENDDPIAIFVKCKKCGEYMLFENKFWVCHKCGQRVKEMTIYSQFDRENEKIIERGFDDDYDEYWE